MRFVWCSPSVKSALSRYCSASKATLLLEEYSGVH